MATLGDVFLPLAFAYQLSLALLILFAGRLDPPRQAITLIFAMNALQVADQLGWLDLGLSLQQHSDFLILGAVTYVLGHYPTSFRRAWARSAWNLVWMAFVVSIVIVAIIAIRDWPDWWLTYRREFKDILFITGLATLAFHTLPAIAKLPPGNLRTQSCFLAAGLGAGLMYTATRFAWRFYLGWEGYRWGIEPRPFFAGTVYWIAGLAVLAVALRVAWMLYRAPREGYPRWLLLALVGPGLYFSIGFDWHPVGVELPTLPNEFFAQVLRPLLVGMAALRFDLFQAPELLRKPLVPATVGLALLTGFVVVYLLASGDSLSASTLRPGPALVAFSLVAAVGFSARERLGGFLRAGTANANERPDRLHRYRMVLEQYEANPNPEAAVATRDMRTRLGVTESEHETIAALLQDHVLVPTAAVAGLKPGVVVDDRWTVEEPLGSGGQGRVFLARQVNTGERAVIKEIALPWRDDASTRVSALRREARALRALPDDAVAKILDIVETPWQTYLVRPYLEGRSLDDVVDKDGPAPIEDGLRVLKDLLNGLAHLHEAGLMHLDVKPANIVMRPDGRATLIDFGSAVQQADDAATTPAEAGFSQRWAAPEQWAGEACDARTDLYAVAGASFFMLTGKLPRPDDGDPAAKAQNWPTGLPSQTKALLVAARKRRPEQRPKSAGEMLSVLRSEWPDL